MSARRVALAAAVVLGVALAVVIAVRTPWQVLPEPPGGYTAIDPTAGLSASQVDRANAFAAALRPASLLSLALGLAVSAILGLTSLGARLVTAVARPFGSRARAGPAARGLLPAAAVRGPPAPGGAPRPPPRRGAA